MRRFSGNLGVSASYNPKNLSWPVTGTALPLPFLPECMGNPVTTLQIPSLEVVVPELQVTHALTWWSAALKPLESSEKTKFN